MNRLSVALMFVLCVTVLTSIGLAQQGGTVRGQIVNINETRILIDDDAIVQEITVRGQIINSIESQHPIEGVEVVIVAQDGTEYRATTDVNGDYKRTGIPAGRYLISLYKDGYGDRLGKPLTVVDGGDHLVSLKMRKKNLIPDFFFSAVPMFWVLILCGLTALVTFLFTKK